MARSALHGEITRISGTNTYRVTIQYKRTHPLYRKIVAYKRSFLVHSDAKHEVGESVKIIPSSHRISKMKHYVIVENSKVTEV